MAAQPGVCFSALCTRFGISRVTGYKWRKRFAAGPREVLADRSRRPHSSPGLVSEQIAAEVIKVRTANPTWGGRKLRRRLVDLKVACPPAASTCTAILRRADLLNTGPQGGPQPMRRFTRALPNELWQMDFKGHFATQSGERCHPLTVLDDHSRFNILLEAKTGQTGPLVQDALTEAFARYGLPQSILCDNGAPWGHPEPICPYTTLTVWLLRLGVTVLHGRPYHPQTQGKEERFHRTLKSELLVRYTWRDLQHCSEEFPRYRHCYNCERPHDALDGDTPITHYRPSVRSMPPHLPPIDYTTHFQTRIVKANGTICFASQTWYVGKAFAGLRIGLRPSTQADPQSEVFFGPHRLGLIDLASPKHPKAQMRSIYASPPQSLVSSSTDV